MMSGISVLKIFAILFGLLAVSNFTKPLQLSGDVGFVLFGQRLTGTANAIAGPLFGLFLAAYAIAILRLKSYALHMGSAYAAYVIANLALFQLYMPADAEHSLGFALGYSAIAIGVSSGAALLLFSNRDALS